MKTKILLFFISLFVLLFSGCVSNQSVSSFQVPDMVAIPRNNRLTHRVDIFNYIPEATIVIYDEREGTMSSTPVRYGDSGWVGWRKGVPYFMSEYAAGFSIKVEVRVDGRQPYFLNYVGSRNVGDRDSYWALKVTGNGIERIYDRN